MATALSVSKEHITKTPGVCGGRACIAGHRIRVQDVVASSERWGMSPTEILDQYPGLTLADVYAALVYYHDHKDEVDADFLRDQELDEFGRTQVSKVREAVVSRSEAEKRGG